MGLFLLTFGVGDGILIAGHMVAFVVGGLTTYLYYGKQESDSTYGRPHSVLRPASNGIESVVGPLNIKQSENLDKRLTGASVIDDVLQEIIEFIFRDYIHSWYTDVSSDTHFPLELRETLRAAIVAFATQAKSASWVPYITGGLVDEVASHIKLYRQAEEAVKKESKRYAGATPDAKFNEKLESKFFDLETDMENNLCRDLICTLKKDRTHYLQNLSEALLFLLLPQSSFDCKILRYLAREVLVNAVLDPTVELLTDPDYVNQCIIWMTEDSAFNRESFLSALKITDSIEELTAVLEKIEYETALHRAQDKGGANDSNIKQVLSSLNYVKKLTAARLQLFASRCGDDEVDASMMMSLTGIGTMDLSSALPLQTLLTNAIGVQYFNDYLITHDYEMYLNLLLDIECCMKVAAEQSQFNASGSVTIAEDRELSEICQDIYSKYTSPEVINKMNLDDTLIPQYKEMMHSSRPSMEVFESLHEQVFERLEVIYEDFKKDHQYRRLLRELKLSSDAAAMEAAVAGTDDVDSSGSADTVKEKEKPFTLYVIEVTQTFDGRPSQRWQTRRRYREFDEFRSVLSSKHADLSSIPFPGKRTFNNMSKEFLDKRTGALNAYLLALFRAEKQGIYAGLLEDLLCFLQRGDWSKERHAAAQRPTSRSESGRFYLSASIKAPAAGTKLSADVIFGDFFQGVGRVFKVGTLAPGSASRESSVVLSSSKNRVGASLDLSGSDDESIPLRIMLLLFDEVFDLRRKNQWFRRRIVAILRQIVKTTLGDSINRRIVEHVDDMLSADRIAEYLRMLRDALWPGGFPAETKPPRDTACRQRTRVVCKAKMLDTIADEVRHFIGSDATNRGVLLVFSMFQHQALNRRLLFVIAEGVFRTLFPNNNFEKVFREMHSRSKRVNRQSNDSSGSSVTGTYSTGLE